MTGFHQDEAGDWVAELACGHNQHVRHRPPFELRPWVRSDPERCNRIGQQLECPLCDRAELPTDVQLVRSAPEWDENTMPPGLRQAHRVGGGTWGRLRVLEGRLRFSMASHPPLELELVGGAQQAIPPEIDHEVQPLGPVHFVLDFLNVDRSSGHAESPGDEGGDPACWAGLICPECGAVLEGDRHRPGCSRPEVA